VVALFLIRTDRAAACVEEIFSSNSINAALGIALPLLFWHEVLHAQTLLLLDGPLMVALTVSALVCVFAGRVGRVVGLGLLLTYAVWVIAQVWI
jgi:Ca2+/Na+ antiporter